MENTSESSYINATENATENASNDIYTFYDFYSFEFPDSYRIIVLVLHWLIPPMICASVFGNIMMIRIMCMPKNRNASTSVFFTALAIADMFLMVFIETERWLFNVIGMHLFGTSQTIARIRIIAENSSAHISSWILAMISLERVIALIVPHRFNSMCTARLASLVVGVECGLIVVFNTIFFTVVIDVGYSDNGGAYWYVDRIEGGFVILSWLDLVFAFIFPFFIIIVGTIIITYQLFRLKGRDLKSNRASILQTLTVVNIVFLITMSPYRVYFFVFQDEEDYSSANGQLFFEIVLTLANLNSTLNFYIYLLARKRFREDLKQLLCYCKMKN